jgi:hypothetical protein
MPRLILALAILIGLVSTGAASLTPSKILPVIGTSGPSGKVAKLTAEEGASAIRGTSSGFLVTDQTEVTLNGQSCKYAEIPSHASILRMEVGPDKKTVLKIHFRTRK